MSFNYEFDAPQFCDFSNIDALENDDADSYFDVDHEAERTLAQQRQPATEEQQRVPAEGAEDPAIHRQGRENTRSGPKNVVMGVHTLLAPGEHPGALRDVTNSPGGAGRGRAPLKRAKAAPQGAPRAKQSRAQAEADAPAERSESQSSASVADEPPPQRPASPAASRGRPTGTAPRRSPRLAAQGPSTTASAAPRGANTSTSRAGRRRSVSAAGGFASRPTGGSGAAAPPLPPRCPTPSAGGRRRTPAPSPAAATGAVPKRRTPSTTQQLPPWNAGSASRRPDSAGRRPDSAGRRPDSAGRRPGSAASRFSPASTSSRRRSMSQNDASRAMRAGAVHLKSMCVAETPNVLRRGLERRTAARAAAEQAVRMEQEERLNHLRKQMADYKKKAALAKKEPVRPRVAPVRATVPEPFHLHEGGTTAAADARHRNDEFKSVAQMVEGFYRKTPPRFHSRPAGVGPDGYKEHPASPRVATVGHTPALATRARTRSHQQRPPSREDLERAELEEAKQHQVRARPVNRRVLESTVGVPARQVRPATRAEPFNLTQQPPKQPMEVEEPTAEFHARPAPRHILEGTTGLPERQPVPATRPQSPALQLKERMADRRKVIVEAPPDAVRRAAVPDNGVPFQPRVEHRRTEPKPFSFENRDKERKAEKERKIQKVLDEERRMREFRAQLMPPPAPHGVPERRVQPTTELRPFQLPGEQVTAEAAARRQRKLEEEAEKARLAAEFQAAPCRVTRQQAFRPRPAEREPVVAQSPHLHTDQRSQRRLSFEERQKQREVELQAQREEAERRRQEAEEAETARLRREAVHRAQPVRHYQPVHVQPSSVPLTIPESPQWASGASRASSNQ